MLRLLPIILLAGCSLLPTPHDSALASSWVNASQELQRVNCEDRTNWQSLVRHAEFLRGYAEFRSDNQVKSAQGLHDNIVKAQAAGNPRVCEHNLKLARSRLDVLRTAWSGR